MDKKLKHLQLYSCIISTVLVFIIFLAMCFMFSDIDLLEMILVFTCFVAPLVIAIPFYISED